ncbi:MAG: TIGR00159 family protein [Ruminococcaceae bacterium]|nr:TIGR00159 family protein [Oscillospiraceae bacterium]
MQEFFSGVFENIVSLISAFTVFDFLDICLVAFIVYNAIKFLRQTRSFQLVKGIVLLLLIYLVISALNMQASTYFMSRIFDDVVLVVLVLFHPEIRHILESVGRRKLSFNKDVRKSEKMSQTITTVCRACSELSDKKVGALIVLERDSILGEIINTGSRIDAVVSEEMIGNIFYPKAPLHDGAIVISDNRIVSAGCILPLTQSSLSSELGTRHRAAVGMSEQGDAVVVVVSEETGAISLASHGMLKRNISPGELRELLTNYFVKEQNDAPLIKKYFGGKKNDR